MVVEMRERRPQKRSHGHKVGMDFSLLFIIIFLICFGLVMLYSTSSYNAMLKFGDSGYYLKKQILATGLGIVAMLAVSRIDYRRYEKWTFLLYILAAVCIVLVKTPLGIEANGATRWIGVGSLSFQPAELAKLAVIMTLAWLISRNRGSLSRPRVVFTILGIAMILAGMIYILTKNLSSAIIVAGIAVVMIFVAAPKIWYLLVIMGVGVAAMAVMLMFSSSFRGERIQAWLNPEQYSSDTAYQTLQSLYAIGSGGLAGKGLGQSVQKLGYVPEAQNDMIFSIICEELGLIGGIAVILLFAFMIWRFMIIANNARELYGSMIVVGVLAHIAIQVVLNIAVVTNTFPNTGITLPFISYGGTSIVFLMIEMGLALAVSRFERGNG